MKIDAELVSFSLNIDVQLGLPNGLQPRTLMAHLLEVLSDGEMRLSRMMLFLRGHAASTLNGRRAKKLAPESSIKVHRYVSTTAIPF